MAGAQTLDTGAGPLVDLHPWPDAHDRREKEDQLDGEGAGAAAGT